MTLWPYAIPGLEQTYLMDMYIYTYMVYNYKLQSTYK